jgi:hypothetical protein
MITRTFIPLILLILFNTLNLHRVKASVVLTSNSNSTVCHFNNFSFTGILSNPGGTALNAGNYIKVKLTTTSSQANVVNLMNTNYVTASYLSNSVSLSNSSLTSLSRVDVTNNLGLYANQAAIDFNINNSFGLSLICDNTNLNFKLTVEYYNSSGSLILSETSNTITYIYDLNQLTCNDFTLVNETANNYNGGTIYSGQVNKLILQPLNPNINCLEPIVNITGSFSPLPTGVSIISIKDNNGNSLGNATSFSIPSFYNPISIEVIYDCIIFPLGSQVPPLNYNINYSDLCNQNRSLQCTELGGWYLVAFLCCNGIVCPGPPCSFLSASFDNNTNPYCLNRCSGGLNSNMILSPCSTSSNLNILNNVLVTEQLPLYHNAVGINCPQIGSNYSVTVTNTGCSFTSTNSGVVPANGIIVLTPPNNCNSSVPTIVNFSLPQINLNNFPSGMILNTLTSFMPNAVQNTSAYKCTLQATGLGPIVIIDSVYLKNCDLIIDMQNVSQSCNTNITTIPSSPSFNSEHIIRHRLKLNTSSSGINNTTGKIEIQLPNSNFIEFVSSYGVRELYSTSGCPLSSSFNQSYAGNSGTSSYFLNSVPSLSTSSTSYIYDGINNKLVFNNVGFKDYCQNGYFYFEYKVRVKPFTPPGAYPISSTISASNILSSTSNPLVINVSTHYELGADMTVKSGAGLFSSSLNASTTCNNLQYRGKITNLGNVAVKSISLFNTQPKSNDVQFSQCTATGRGSTFSVGSTSYAITATNPTVWSPSLFNLNSNSLTIGSTIPKGSLAIHDGFLSYCASAGTLPVGTNSSIALPNNFVLQPGQSVEFFTNNNLTHNGIAGQVAKNNFSFNVIRTDNNQLMPITLSNTCTLNIVGNTSTNFCNACDSTYADISNPGSTTGYSPKFLIKNKTNLTITKIKLEILPSTCYPTYQQFVYNGLNLLPTNTYTAIPALSNVSNCIVSYKVTLYTINAITNTLDSCIGATNTYAIPLAGTICAKVKLKVFLTGALVHNANSSIVLLDTMEMRLKGAGGAFVGAYNCNNLVPATSANYLTFTEPYTTSYTNLWQQPIGSNNFAAVGVPAGQTISSTNMINYKMVDWIVVELRNKLNPSIVVATKRVALIGGNVVGSNVRDNLHVGGSPTDYVEFKNIPADEYVVVVRHRNHLGIQTLNVYDTYTTKLLDFTKNSGTDVVPLYTNNLFPNLPYRLTTVNSNTFRALIPGDVNSDGSVKYDTGGPDSDYDLMETIVKCNVPSNSNTAQKYWYSCGDVRMDKMIRFNGIYNDRLVMLLAYNSTVNPNYNWNGTPPAALLSTYKLFQHIQ